MLNKDEIFVSFVEAKNFHGFAALRNVKKFFAAAIIFCSVVFSCHQDVINIDLTEIGTQIVIEGSITDRDGPYTIKITRTRSHFRQGDYPPVTEAVVRLSDNAGHSETLVQTEPGIYKTLWTQGIPGRTYRLKVSVEGEEYTASSTMPLPIALDSLNYLKVSDPYMGEVAFLSIYFTDRKGADDYCRFKIYRNGDILNDDYNLYHGKYTDGEQVLIDNFNNLFYLNDYVRIELLTIDKAVYEYWSTLDSLLDHDFDDDEMDTVFSPLALFNPTSNLSNNALGYFSAHTMRVYTFTIR